jgi:hypothetical protein
MVLAKPFPAHGGTFLSHILLTLIGVSSGHDNNYPGISQAYIKNGHCLTSQEDEAAATLFSRD